MYISIKLPPAFGSFNRLRKENYPFNSLFTSYLAAVSRLGLALQMDVEELVGYIEDRVFDGQRLPDVPDGEGDGPVNFRYKTEDPDVTEYIGGCSGTNRMAVMYIARMTLRLSAAYGTSLFRLTRLITDLSPQAEAARKPKEQARKEPVKPKERPAPRPVRQEQEEDMPAAPMPRVTNKAPATQEPAPVMPGQVPSSVQASADAAKAALNELAELTAQADTEQQDGQVVQTNPFLNSFL